MNIVRIRHEKNDYAKEYLFETAEPLKKGDMVMCDTVLGNTIGYAIADSNEINPDDLKYFESLSSYKLPLKRILGKYEYVPFSEHKVLKDKDDIKNMASKIGKDEYAYLTKAKDSKEDSDDIIIKYNIKNPWEDDDFKALKATLDRVCGFEHGMREE